ADGAAYSNAIVTARAYNQIAVWNRAQIAHMMTLAGVQSHISYASWYVALLKGSEYGGYATAGLAGLICAGCGPWCPWCCTCCPTVAVAIKFARAFNREYNTAKRQLDRVDQQMATQAMAIQGFASLYGSAGKLLYGMHTLNQLNGGLANAVQDLVTSKATNPGEYGIDTLTNVIVNASELRNAGAESTQNPSLEITNGTRESDFLRSRGWAATPPYPPVIAAQNRSITAFFASGTGHFGDSKHNPVKQGNNQAWADDEGFAAGVVNLPSPCPLPTGWYATAEVKSSAKNHPSHHRSSPNVTEGGSTADRRHDLMKCQDAKGNPCNSVWVGRQEFNINYQNAQQLADAKTTAGAGDQWRQPVNMVRLTRNYGARSKRDPWEFKFKLEISNSGGGQQVDLKAPSMNEQTAIATAITYYHRNMQAADKSWEEPPNFFNPYWRATLVPADIDGAANLTMSMRGNISAQLLKGAGFKGIQ
ncbi:MAG: hypothetical protein FJ086_09510, partial [Deltaproteobacteria bacterium]|nr:hypothetical protein [Deltaproteobacteria bacterium]